MGITIPLMHRRRGSCRRRLMVGVAGVDVVATGVITIVHRPINVFIAAVVGSRLR